MSQSNKHTPGPWQVGSAFDNYGEIEIAIEHMTPAGNLVVAVAIGGLQGQDANARLIAAAPELLEALIVVADTFGEDWLEGSTQRRLGDKARDAIAKATGETK